MPVVSARATPARAADPLRPHLHAHALVTDGEILPDGSFERVWHWDRHAPTELSRRLVLAALRREQRLTEETHLKLLSWKYAGFSVYVGAPILPADTQMLEHLARYLCRAPQRRDNVRQEAQRVVVRTPLDPITCATERKLDPRASSGATVPTRGPAASVKSGVARLHPTSPPRAAHSRASGTSAPS